MTLDVLDPDKRWCRLCYTELKFNNEVWRWVAEDDDQEFCTPTSLHDPSREIPKMWKDVEVKKEGYEGCD